MKKCVCPLTDQYPFLCDRHQWEMRKKSHEVCRGEHGEETYEKYQAGWLMGRADKILDKQRNAKEEQDRKNRMVKSKRNWAYGITTVLSRRTDLLPRTMKSLASAGFDKPRLFVDGCTHKEAIELYEEPLKGKIDGITIRDPKVFANGSWYLALLELYILNPNANYYAIFQDDMVTYLNLRAYLEAIDYPLNGYMNLYTFPKNQRLAPKDLTGLFLSNQQGLGAVALVFDLKTVYALFSNPHLIERIQNPTRGKRAIDGGVVTALSQKSGISEYVHNPSLVQHIGDISAIGNANHAKADSFKGENFDAIELLPIDKQPKNNKVVKSNGKGLGDRTEKALRMFGITEKRVSKWLGNCGCSERKEKLNRLGAWASRILSGKIDNAEKHLENIMKDDDDENCS